MVEESVLHATELVCGYSGRGLFQPVTFSLAPGSATQVTGPNGQGKTTLLQTVAGLKSPLAGHVTWRSGSRLCETLCYVGHRSGLNPALTPLDNLDLLLHLSGSVVTRRHMRNTLDKLGLGRLSRRPCGRLSAGQQRRVSLARLWLTTKSVWLLDEPAAALDAGARTALCAHIADFAANGGIVLFTTHEALTLPEIDVSRLELQPC